MANTTAKQYTKQGNVIFHPHFDRPQVQNAKRTGRYPKGVVSFKANALRRRNAGWLNRVAEINAKTRNLAAAPLLQSHQRLTGYLEVVMDTDYETAFHMASAALKKHQEMINAQAAR